MHEDALVCGETRDGGHFFLKLLSLFLFFNISMT